MINETNTINYYQEGSLTQTIDYLYDGNLIIGIKYNNGFSINTYFFERNILGDVVGIYDTDGNLKVRYLYDAYGNCTISSETIDQALARVNPIRYRGYYYDVETGLYYCKSRYYNPEWCRWISPDDIEYLEPESINGLNLYCYCKNNPIMYVDPSGHIAWWVLLAIVVVCSLTLEGDSSYKYDSKITADDLNINGNNPNGKIEVKINNNYIIIYDSYKYENEEDMKKILEIIMNSECYQDYGFSRSLNSYLSEWNAHNFAYSVYKKGEWGKRTMSVDLDKNLRDDPFWYLYWLF